MLSKIQGKMPIVAFLVGVSILAVGARHVVRERRHCKTCLEQQHREWLDWHRTLADDMSMARQRNWVKAADETPEALLRGCSVPVGE